MNECTITFKYDYDLKDLIFSGVQFYRNLFYQKLYGFNFLLMFTFASARAVTDFTAHFENEIKYIKCNFRDDNTQNFTYSKSLFKHVVASFKD